MLQRTRVLTFLVFALGISLACSRRTEQAHVQEANQDAPPASPRPGLASDPTPIERGADDAARFLAGLPGKEGSPFKELENQEAWKTHSNQLNAQWSNLEATNFPGMRAFQKRELGSESITKSVLFYPFGGPDSVTATMLFPDNANSVLVSLEPTGTLPTPKALAAKPLGPELGAVRETLESVLRRSFFITREMDRQFRGQITDGLLPPILELLVRNGNTVRGIRMVRLDDEGRIVTRPVGYKSNAKIENRGVEIEFERDANKTIHKMYYFSVNLSDERMKQNKPFRTFLSRIEGMTTFLKSTSYMPHKEGFTEITGEILKLSQTVLQDDSGLPYKCFAAGWDVQLYGDYDKPYGSFHYLAQKDLKEAYQTLKPKPLGFRIGYGYSKVPSNLLMARRKLAASLKH